MPEHTENLSEPEEIQEPEEKAQVEPTPKTQEPVMSNFDRLRKVMYERNQQHK